VGIDPDGKQEMSSLTQLKYMVVKRRGSSVDAPPQEAERKEECKITKAIIIIVRQKVRRVMIDRNSCNSEEVAVSFVQSWQSIRPMTTGHGKQVKRWVRP
jgi:hypothetical protein